MAKLALTSDILSPFCVALNRDHSLAFMPLSGYSGSSSFVEISIYVHLADRSISVFTFRYHYESPSMLTLLREVG